MFTLYLWYLLFVKKLSYIPRIYLKYNVRKGMVGRSEDVPRTFKCLMGNYCVKQKVSLFYHLKGKFRSTLVVR